MFIGKNLNKQRPVEGFLKCKIDAVLRFDVGGKVRASGQKGWGLGVIYKFRHDCTLHYIKDHDVNGFTVALMQFYAKTSLSSEAIIEAMGLADPEPVA